MIQEKKGFIKIRKINDKSIGITLPSDLVRDLKLDIGQYTYKATKEKGILNLSLKIL